MKRRILSVLGAILLLSVLSITAFAVEVPDLDRKGSISITMTHRGTAVPGGSLTLYRVADVQVENGADYSFGYTQEYAQCQVSLKAIGNARVAKELADYTEKNKISGTKLQIDRKGKISFRNLELGLYLLVQEDAATGYELVSPFLVTVPGRANNRYVYDVDASPKLDLERAPTTPTQPTTKPTLPSKLPQTGLNQWPVPALAASGLFFFTVGWYLHASGKKKEHES